MTINLKPKSQVEYSFFNSLVPKFMTLVYK